MKTSILSTLFFIFCVTISVYGKDHKQELHQISDRIKQAVKAGKITEKEGWAKWHNVLRDQGRHLKGIHGDDEDEYWGVLKELKLEIKTLELEFELERLEHEHDIQRMEWNHERERMKRDFERERREWDMGNLQLDVRRKQMEMQMRGGMPHHGILPAHPHGGRATTDLPGGTPPNAMPHPMGRGAGQMQEVVGRENPNSKRKSGGKKEKVGSDKKESCKLGRCSEKGAKSFPDKNKECSKQKKKK